MACVAKNPFVQYCLTNQKFVTVKKFDTLQSTDIVNALTGSDGVVRFSKLGNLQFAKHDGSLPWTYYNEIVPNSRGEQIYSGVKEIKSTTLSNPELFITDNGYWILVADKQAKSVSILYNPLHRLDFKNYFDSCDSAAAMNLFSLMCDKIDNVDGTCMCLPDDTNHKCLRDFINDPDVYNAIASNPTTFSEMNAHCPCANDKCKRNAQNLENSSFITEIMAADKYGLDNCKENTINITFCNQTVSFKDIKGNLPALSQNCKGAVNTSATTGNQQQPTAGNQQQPTTGNQQQPTTGNQQQPTTGNQQQPTAGNQQQNKPSLINITNITIVVIILIVLVVLAMVIV